MPSYVDSQSSYIKDKCKTCIYKYKNNKGVYDKAIEVVSFNDSCHKNELCINDNICVWDKRTGKCLYNMTHNIKK